MPEQTVSILAEVQDLFSEPLQRLNKGLASIQPQATALDRAFNPLIRRFFGIHAAIRLVSSSMRAARESGLAPTTFAKLDAEANKFGKTLVNLGTFLAGMKTVALEAVNAITDMLRVTTEPGRHQPALEEQYAKQVRGIKSVQGAIEALEAARVRSRTRPEDEVQTDEQMFGSLMRRIQAEREALDITKEQLANQRGVLEDSENLLKTMREQGRTEAEIVNEVEQRNLQATRVSTTEFKVLELQAALLKLEEERNRLAEKMVDRKVKVVGGEGRQADPFAPSIITASDQKMIAASVEKLRELEAVSRRMEVSGGFAGAIKDATARSQELGTVTGEVTSTAITGFSNLGGVIVDAFIEGRNAGEALREFFGRLLLDVGKMILQMALLRAITAGIGLVFGGGGIVAAGGGLIRRFAAGGGTTGTDTVPAMLTPGEYVVRRSAVDHYGAGVMEALNRMLVPRSMMAGVAAGVPITSPGRRHFATGGAVGDGVGGPAKAVVVADDQSVDRLLSGGRGAMLRFFRENSNTLSNILSKGKR